MAREITNIAASNRSFIGTHSTSTLLEALSKMRTTPSLCRRLSGHSEHKMVLLSEVNSLISSSAHLAQTWNIYLIVVHFLYNFSQLRMLRQSRLEYCLQLELDFSQRRLPLFGGYHVLVSATESPGGDNCRFYCRGLPDMH